MADDTLASSQSSLLQGITYGENELSALLDQAFKFKTDDAKSAVEQAVLTLAQQALAQTTLISSDVVASIEALIAAIDAKLSAQVNAILHHADF